MMSIENTQAGLNKNSIQNSADDLTKLAGQAYDTLTKKASQTADELQKETKEYCDKTKSYIEENPVKAVMIAAAVGAFLGLLLKK